MAAKKKAVRKTAKKAVKKAAKKATPKTVKKVAVKAAAAGALLGKSAPNFTMPTDNGGSISLKDLRGKNVVLYFYPKDDTPGCTVEACAFRDGLPKFNTAKAVVIGVSKDSVASHQKFKTKYKLNFPLASDDSGVCEAYGVWKEKNMYGRKYMGIERSTFIIDAEGVVKAEWRKVSVPGHADEVTKTLQML
ncbi:MAG: thioredoxin-dependent thiol peroxidase [Rhodospirillaceae bacterium]|nr:thioredoxin-dependent thiol peroxidase [Rhodospirillaceae bacterium]